MTQSIRTRRAELSTLAATFVAAAAMAAPLLAQTTYTVVDLTPGASGAVGSAADGQFGGYTGATPNAFSGRATLWTDEATVDLHPSFLEGASARSTVTGIAGTLQVGSGAGTSTSNRNIPLAWSGSAASATALPIPVANAGGQANATDGVQIVGSIIGLDRDGTTLGTNHAMLWDIPSGSATDLGEDAVLFGVAAGQQVGWVLKGSAAAALWRGTRAYTLLHPKGAVTSVANATDGTRQVGYAGFDIRVRQEAAKGNKNKRFTYAYLWSGTAASGLNIHPYASNADNKLLEFSYALKIAGQYIVGYATDPSKINTPAYNRAIVWDANLQATDLNAFLPAGFIGSVAYTVDADGTVGGVMTKADGTRHAVLWVPNP